ncbi:hypothetical protein, partial [Staphylococcus epidermidis]|uniref:hypothetical protein n=1 Tax=Staphylococcus epidermidis TaxID=1282 RepID=UPI003F68A7BB
MINPHHLDHCKHLLQSLQHKNTTKILYHPKKTYLSPHPLPINIQNIQFDLMLPTYIIHPSPSIHHVKSL